jgi:hypothetical protein
LDHYRVQFSHHNLGINREIINGCFQGETHAQATHQHPGIFFNLQGLTSQFRQNDLGPVGRGVHQHPTIDGYKKIRLAPLPKIEKSLIGTYTVNYPPRLSHLKSLT